MRLQRIDSCHIHHFDSLYRFSHAVAAMAPRSLVGALAGLSPATTFSDLFGLAIDGIVFARFIGPLDLGSDCRLLSMLCLPWMVDSALHTIVS